MISFVKIEMNGSHLLISCLSSLAHAINGIMTDMYVTLQPAMFVTIYSPGEIGLKLEYISWAPGHLDRGYAG